MTHCPRQITALGAAGRERRVRTTGGGPEDGVLPGVCGESVGIGLSHNDADPP